MLLGLLIGLGRLTKFYTIILLPLALLAIACAAWRSRSLRKLWMGVSVVVIVLLLVSASWLWAIEPDSAEAVPRGWGEQAYRLLDVVHMERWFSSSGRGKVGGGLTALPKAMLNFWRQEPGRWAVLLFKSYWAFFGAVTLEAGAGVYVFFLVIVLLSAWGLARRTVRFIRNRESIGPTKIGLGVLALQALAFLGVMVVNYGVMDRLPGPAQGRHLYPAIAAMSILLSLGFTEVLRARSNLPAVALSLGMLAVSVYCLPMYILPGYRDPLPVRSSAYPDVQHALETALGDDLALVGYDMPGGRATAGSTIPLSLYWHGLRPMSRDYQFSVSLVDGRGVELGLWAGHPAGGRYPTRAWDPGDHVRDSLELVIPACVTPGRYDLGLALWSGAPGTGELLACADLTSLDIVEGTGKNPAVVMNVDLGDGLVLLGYDLIGGRKDGDGLVAAGSRETIWLTLYWQHQGVERSDVPIRVTLLKADGREWARQTQESVGNGPRYCARYLFTVGPDTPSGQYRAKVRALGLGKTEFDIPVRVANRERIFAVPPVQHVSGVTFGDCIILEGYDMGDPRRGADEEAAVSAGDSLDLTLYWRALCPIGENYTVFVHLADESGELLAQDDQLPCHDYATLFWAEREVVRDQYRLTTSISTPPGSYRIEVGFYHSPDGERLPVRAASGVSAGDRWILDQVQVVKR